MDNRSDNEVVHGGFRLKSNCVDFILCIGQLTSNFHNMMTARQHVLTYRSVDFQFVVTVL